MTNIDRNFLLMALAWLMIGTVFGFWMGASNNPQYVGVHVTMLLPGFVTFAIYGFIYRLWPELKPQALARFQFWFAAVSLPFMVIGGGMQVQSGSVFVIAAASVVAIISAAMMTYMFWNATRAA